jgi:hypothetical protein
MYVSMPIHDFARLRLVVRLSATGEISMSFKPREPEDDDEPIKDSPALDSSLHFDGTTVNGVSELVVYMSCSSPNLGTIPRNSRRGTDSLWPQ